MKTITIPTKFGYPKFDMFINGKKYTFKSGEEITVEDYVADIIENAIALAPKYGKNIGKLAQLAEGSIEEITAFDLQGITKIRGSGFYNCRSIKSVTIPDNIDTIESHAFFSCVNMEKVTLGNGLTKIFASVFDGCSSLTKVYLPKMPPTLVDINTFNNINDACVFYCKTQASLDAYKAAANWSTLTGTYVFKVASK